MERSVSLSMAEKDRRAAHQAFSKSSENLPSKKLGSFDSTFQDHNGSENTDEKTEKPL